MSLALAAIGLRSSITNFLASRRISMILFSRAKSGARGKEATKRVTIPNWMTKETDERKNLQLVQVTWWTLCLLFNEGKLTGDTTAKTQFSSGILDCDSPSLGEKRFWWICNQTLFKSVFMWKIYLRMKTQDEHKRQDPNVLLVL